MTQKRENKYGYRHIDLQVITQAANEMASRSVGINALGLADQEMLQHGVSNW